MKNNFDIETAARKLPDEHNILHTLIYGEIETAEYAQKIINTTSDFLLVFCGIGLVFSLSSNIFYTLIPIVIFFLTIVQKKLRSYLLGIFFIFCFCLLAYMELFWNTTSLHRGRAMVEISFLILLSIRSLYAIHYLKFYKKNSAN